MSPMQTVSPPRAEDFSNEQDDSGDEKHEMPLDMSLDEIMKINRDTMMQSPPEKDRTQSEPEDARETIRRSAVSRQSRMRDEGKHGKGYFKPAVNQMKNRGWNRQRTEPPPRRSGLPRRHLTPGDKVNIYEGAAGKLKISVVNENAKPGFPPPSRARINWGHELRGRRYPDDYDPECDYDVGRIVSNHVSPKMDGPPTRHRTLDSLFAKIKEQRELGRPYRHMPDNGGGRYRRPGSSR